jgi:hypothetical protein
MRTPHITHSFSLSCLELSSYSVCCPTNYYRRIDSSPIAGSSSLPSFSSFPSLPSLLFLLLIPSFSPFSTLIYLFSPLPSLTYRFSLA